jgi:hypothetical protein
MEDKFKVNPGDNMITLKLGPTLEETLSDEYKKQAHD